MRRAALQLLALVPIPIIAALVWWSGKRPPPPPPPLAKAGAGHSAGAPKASVKLPATMKSGWKLQGKVVRYNQKTLFDRINGAAPAYIRAGFVASYGAEYVKKGYADAVVVDAYDMGTPLQGLGMYATERDASYTFIEVGNEGYLASGSLNLWYGRFYIKMAGFEEGEAMDRGLRELAADLVAALPRAPEAAVVTAPAARLPAAGRVPHSVGYIKPALSDIAGLEQIFYVDYKEGEQTYRLFVVQAKDEAAATARVAKINNYFTKDGARVQEGAEGAFPLLLAAGDTTTFVMRAGAVLAGGVDLEAAAVTGARTRVAASLGEAKKP